jgi:hypothetical protein
MDGRYLYIRSCDECPHLEDIHCEITEVTVLRAIRSHRIHSTCPLKVVISPIKGFLVGASTATLAFFLFTLLT